VRECVCMFMRTRWCGLCSMWSTCRWWNLQGTAGWLPVDRQRSSDTGRSPWTMHTQSVSTCCPQSSLRRQFRFLSLLS